MNRSLQNVIGICCCLTLLSIIGVCYYAAFTMQEWAATGRQATVTLQAISGTSAKLDATLDQIDAPCTGFHGSETCGPIAQLSQTEKNIGIMAGQSAAQVRQTGALISGATAALTSASADLHTVAMGLTTLTGEASADLREGKQSLEALPPVLSQFRGFVKDADVVVTDPAIPRTLQHVEGMTVSGDSIMQDGKRVSDHVEEAIDHPRPMTAWQKIMAGLEIAWKVAILAK